MIMKTTLHREERLGQSIERPRISGGSLNRCDLGAGQNEHRRSHGRLKSTQGNRQNRGRPPQPCTVPEFQGLNKAPSLPVESNFPSMGMSSTARSTSVMTQMLDCFDMRFVGAQ